VATDPYWKILRKNWPDIYFLYERFAHKHPVMLYDIQKQRVYAYPYKEFRADLSKRSQVSLKEQYEHANANDMVVVFVRDNEKEKLKSYSVPLS
jgi:hypothetical protein